MPRLCQSQSDTAKRPPAILPRATSVRHLPAGCCGWRPEKCKSGARRGQCSAPRGCRRRRPPPPAQSCVASAPCLESQCGASPCRGAAPRAAARSSSRATRSRCGRCPAERRQPRPASLSKRAQWGDARACAGRPRRRRSQRPARLSRALAQSATRPAQSWLPWHLGCWPAPS